MPFTIITDHASLKWLMGLKDLSGRLARWALQLQSFDFQVEYRKGKDNVVADMLSRPIGEIAETNIQLNEINEKEFKSDDYIEIIETINKNKANLPDLQVENGKVYRRTPMTTTEDSDESEWKLWIPAAMTKQLIQQYHDPPNMAHGGVAKTLERLRRFYYWPKMAVEVKIYVGNCQTCKESKPTNQITRPPMGNETITERPFQKLYIDFLGKYTRSKKGNAYIFIVLDHFSKFVFLKSMREATSKAVNSFLISEVFHKFGTPEIIHSDNGKQFVSKEFKNMVKSYGIKHITNAVYAPQANASERVNQSVLAAIRSYMENDHRDWDVHLTEIECALRTSVHTATGTTPYFALFGQHMYTCGADYQLARKLHSLAEPWQEPIKRQDKIQIIHEKIKTNIHNAYERNAKQYNKRSRVVKYKPGQEIYKKNFVLSDFAKNFNAKFAKKYTKCRVVKPIGNCLYELETLQGRPLGTFHAKDLKL